ncbi:hypothetical protein Trydic_g6654 [Trypoxylus dichotomus]
MWTIRFDPQTCLRVTFSSIGCGPDRPDVPSYPSQRRCLFGPRVEHEERVFPSTSTYKYREKEKVVTCLSGG